MTSTELRSIENDTTPAWSGINHLALITTDMDATVRFYHGVLGARIAATVGTPTFRHYFFDLGPHCTVAFFEYADVTLEPFAKPAGVPDPRAVQFDHLALNLPDEQALHDLRQRLTEADCEVTEIIDHGSVRSVYFTDPSGIALEASWWVHDVTGCPSEYDDAQRFGDPDPVPALVELRTTGRARVVAEHTSLVAITEPKETDMTQTFDADATAAAPAPPDPSAIMQVGLGFWPSKTLLTAVELGLFTVLGDRSLTAAEIADELQLRSRAVFDFLDGLVSVGLLDRAGAGDTGRYANTRETAVFLDTNSPLYIGGILEMANARLYRFWDGLTEALRTGEPQNEIKHTGRSMFEELYADPERLEQFMRAMSGISLGNFAALAETFDFSQYATVCDVGGATGQLSIMLAQRHAHLRCLSFDLPVVEPIAQRTIDAAGVADRVTTASGDFFADGFPHADVITMGMILHDWNLDRKRQLIQAAYDALPEGGALIAIENIIDDDRRQNVFGLMMSLNMLIEFGDAFDFTGADYRGWCEDAGFRKVEILPLAGPASAGIAYK